MLKKTMLIAAFSLTLTNLANADQKACQLSQTTNDRLYNFLQEIADQDESLIDTIKTQFGTENQQIIDFLMQQIDPVQIALDSFREMYTPAEIEEILDFHTSETGRKFMATFNNLCDNFFRNFMTKISNLQSAILTVMSEQTQTTD